VEGEFSFSGSIGTEETAHDLPAETAVLRVPAHERIILFPNYQSSRLPITVTTIYFQAVLEIEFTTVQTIYIFILDISSCNGTS
jgi:hypothetical protein